MVPLRVEGSKGLCFLEVELSPVGATPVVVHDLFYTAEVAVMGGSPKLVDGYVGALPAGGRRQGDVIGTQHPEFDGEADWTVQAFSQLPYPSKRLDAVLAGHCVLHLVEPNPTGAREDRVAGGHILSPAALRCHQGVDPGNERRS